MGARQSKRSVDITTTPKKDGEIITAEGEGKLEKIGDPDIKVTTNGSAHTEIEFADKEENGKGESEKDEEIKENGVSESEDAKTPDIDVPAAGDQINESVIEKTENVQEISEKIEETPETKKNKDKSKKKKWSFRSISFSKKDKSKPNKESEKNGEVKEVAEENIDETATSPAVETSKTEEPKATEVTPEPAVINGEEITKPKEDEAKPVVEEISKPTEEPKAPDSKETPVESAPSPIKEELPPPAPVVEESTSPVEQPKVDEPKIETLIEEKKEVRNEEIPPPLPASNPPSSVTVFAESTKADALPAGPVPQDPQSPISVSVFETIPEPPVTESVIAPIPPAAVSPVVENLPIHSSAPLVEKTVTTEPVSPAIKSVEPTSLVEPASTEPKETPAKCDIKTIDSLPTLDSTSKIESNPLPEELTTPPASPVVTESKIPEPAVQPVLELNNTEPLSSNTTSISALEPIPVPQVETVPAFAEKNLPEPDLIPPSPVEVEKTDLSDNSVSESLPAPPSEENLPEPEIVPMPPTDSPVKEPVSADVPLPEPLSVSSEPVANADSLPDISTESLPSLPEPISENLPEPLSLPPIDLIPQPITDTLPDSPPAPIQAPVLSSPPKEIVLTNGTSNGLSSPTTDDVSLQRKDGPLKQVDVCETKDEVRQDGDTADIAKAQAVTSVEE